MGIYYREIPDDILIEILSRLPFKTLARFNCVSKQWKRLIRNAIINMKHRTKLLIFDNEDFVYSLRDINNEACLEKVHALNYDCWCWGYEAGLCVYSSCYGLLLIGIPDGLLVWNPLTQFIDYIPSKWYTLIDLCFDYANDVYKIIYFSTSLGRDHLAYVSTLGSNCHDKVISLPYGVSSQNLHKGTFVNGFIHYFSKVGWSSDVDLRNYSRNRICYFDPSAMMFFELPIPWPKNNLHDTILGLGVLDGCLCMTRLENPENYEGSIEFVVMKIYANGLFWVTTLSISQVPQLSHRDTLKPLLMTRKGEILVCKSRYVYRYYGHSELESVIKVYDLNGKFLRDITIPSSSYRKKWYSDVVLYEESWFSPSAYRRVTPRNRGDFLDVFKDNVDDRWKNYHWEDPFTRLFEYLDFELISELGSMLEVEYSPRKKKSNKKMEKKSRRTKIATQYSGKKIERKKHYEPKYVNIYIELTANS